MNSIISKVVFFSTTLTVILCFSGCGGNADEPGVSEIKELEIKLSQNEQAFDKETAQKLHQAYIDFVDLNSNKPESVGYLYKAAEIANSLGYYQKAINLYNRFYNENPDHEKAAVCIFIQAFIYENHMKKLDLAEQKYNQFLADYPDHALAKDARFSLDNLGKSVEELLKQFESKGSKI